VRRCFPPSLREFTQPPTTRGRAASYPQIRDHTTSRTF
jgi:hypothetical protein